MTFEEMITNYIALRDKKEAIETEFKKTKKKYTDAMATIAEYLQGYMRSNNLQNIASKDGTAFIKTTRSATVGDKSAFREYVIESKNFDLADFRANVEAVQDFMKENNQLPPGVNFSTAEEVGVQRR